MNSLHKTVTRHRCDCDLNPGPSAPESSTLTTPSHPGDVAECFLMTYWRLSVDYGDVQNIKPFKGFCIKLFSIWKSHLRYEMCP